MPRTWGRSLGPETAARWAHWLFPDLLEVRSWYAEQQQVGKPEVSFHVQAALGEARDCSPTLAYQTYSYVLQEPSSTLPASPAQNPDACHLMSAYAWGGVQGHR